MKLPNTLLFMFSFQILLFFWAFYITYSSSHDGKDDFSGLDVLLPIGLVIVISLVEAILLIVYIIGIKKRKYNLNPVLLVLILLVVTLGLFYTPINRTLMTLSGSSYLPDNDFDVYNTN